MAQKKSKHNSKESKNDSLNTKSKKERREELKKPTLKKMFQKNFPLMVVGVFFLLIVLLVFMQDRNTTNVLGTNSTEAVEMIYFHLPTCPHCIEQNKFNKKLIEAYPNLRIVKYNMELQSSREVLNEYINKTPGLASERIGTPLTIIGEQYNIGFGTEETTGLKLSQLIDEEIKKLEASSIE